MITIVMGFLDFRDDILLFLFNKSIEDRCRAKTTKYFKRPHLDINEMAMHELVLLLSSGISLA